MKRENMPAEHALRRLERAVQLVTSVPEACARDPGRDFTRNRKIPLNALVWIMITWAWDTIGTELEDACGWDGAAPTASAFCQQRAKLRDDVMPRVSSAFLAMWERAPLMGRFVLYGVDGTDVQLCPSSDPRTRVRSNKSGAEHNEAHPTMAYVTSPPSARATRTSSRAGATSRGGRGTGRRRGAATATEAGGSRAAEAARPTHAQDEPDPHPATENGRGPDQMLTRPAPKSREIRRKGHPRRRRRVRGSMRDARDGDFRLLTTYHCLPVTPLTPIMARRGC